VWWLQVLETMYSIQELADMHFIYSLAEGNPVVAHHLYQEKWEWKYPDRKTSVSIHHYLCEHGNFAPHVANGTTKIYDSWSRGGYSGCCEWNSYNQDTKSISASGCHSFDCVEGVVRTTVSAPSADCTGLFSTRLTCMSNVLPVVLTTLVQILISLPLWRLRMKHSLQETESRIFTISIYLQMKIHTWFFHHVTNSGSLSTFGPVLGWGNIFGPV
jgi:hypothetical protein